MRKTILFLFFILKVFVLLSQTNDRIALVIGNANYVNGGAVLRNPVNDANLMAQTLQKLGFIVIKKLDANLETMQSAAVDFTNRIKSYKIALFYYAGHGVQVDGQNFLIPVDANLKDKLRVKYEGFNIADINDAFRDNSDNLNIMILDACRDNPFRSWMRGGSTGFKVIGNQAAGSIIAFATREGETAADGSGNNGLFTEKLAQQLVKSQFITDVFQNTRAEVLKASHNTQCPQEWNMLTGNIDLIFQPGNSNNNLSVANSVNNTNNTSNNPNNSNSNDFNIKSQPGSNKSGSIVIEEEALTGSLKIINNIEDVFYIDDKSSSAFNKNKIYTLKNIPVGLHTLKIGSWSRVVNIETNKMLEVTTEEEGTLKIASKITDTCFIDDKKNSMFFADSVYTINNLPVGAHKVKVGKFVKSVNVEPNSITDVLAREQGTLKILNSIDDTCYLDNKFKAVLTKDNTYTFEDVAAGLHNIKVGSCMRNVRIEPNKITETITRNEGSIKIHSKISDSCYIDNINKGKFSRGSAYTFENIPAGEHSLRIGSWFKFVTIETNKITEITSEEDFTVPFVDTRDNKKYKMINIHNQVWMLSNMDYNTGKDSWCYDDNNSNCEKYGRLYSHLSAVNACPAGWRLPKKEDFDTLMVLLGSNEEDIYNKMTGTGNSGFSTLMGGFGFGSSRYTKQNDIAIFWTSSTFDNDNTWTLMIKKNNKKINKYVFSNDYCFSVRCIRNE